MTDHDEVVPAWDETDRAFDEIEELRAEVERRTHEAAVKCVARLLEGVMTDPMFDDRCPTCHVRGEVVYSTFECPNKAWHAANTAKDDGERSSFAGSRYVTPAEHLLAWFEMHCRKPTEGQERCPRCGCQHRPDAPGDYFACSDPWHEQESARES